MTQQSWLPPRKVQEVEDAIIDRVGIWTDETFAIVRDLLYQVFGEYEEDFDEWSE